MFFFYYYSCHTVLIPFVFCLGFPGFCFLYDQSRVALLCPTLICGCNNSSGCYVLLNSFPEVLQSSSSGTESTMTLYCCNFIQFCLVTSESWLCVNCAETLQSQEIWKNPVFDLSPDDFINLGIRSNTGCPHKTIKQSNQN